MPTNPDKWAEESVKNFELQSPTFSEEKSLNEETNPTNPLLISLVVGRRHL
jgi:hypothetical protein